MQGDDGRNKCIDGNDKIIMKMRLQSFQHVHDDVGNECKGG